MKEPRHLRTPAALLPYQIRWVADLSDVKVHEKSRRIGISWSEAADDSLLAASESGMDCWYIGYNRDMAQEFIEDCAEWSRHYQHVASSVEEFVFTDEEGNRDILAFRVRYASGFKIVALSSRPTNLRAKQGKIIIDEAAFHPDFDGLLKAAMAHLIWGGKVVIISSHNGEDNPFNQVVMDIRSGKEEYKDFSLHRIDFDEAIADGLYQRVCIRRKIQWTPSGQAEWRDKIVRSYGEHANEELFCIPSRGSGIFLPGSLIERCMREDIPVLRLSCDADFVFKPERVRQSYVRDWLSQYCGPFIEKMSPHFPTYFGEDFGRSGDVSFIFPLQEELKLKYRAPFLLEERNVPFQQQEEVLFWIMDRFPRFRGGALDARGNGQSLAEKAMQRYGVSRIEQIMLTDGWYREHMPPYKRAYEDEELSIAKDADVLDDHRALRMVKGVARIPDSYKGKGRDGKQRHGDSAIAGALGWYAVKHFGDQRGSGEARSAGKRETVKMMRGYTDPIDMSSY